MKLPTLVRTYDNLIPAAIELTIRGENLKRGDLLIADASEDRMDIGKAIEVIDTDDRLTFGGLHVIHARPNSGLFHPGFAGQLMQSKRCRLEFMRRANGASVLGLSSKQISQIELIVPGREEQEKIAGFLGVVDARFGLLKRKKELLEAYKKGVMQKLFSREIRFKDEEGRGYPEWEEKRLGDVGSTYAGLSGKTKEDFGAGALYIQYMQVFSKRGIDFLKCDRVQVRQNEHQNLVKLGDALFTTSSETPLEIGTCSVVTKLIPEPVYLNSFCFGFRFVIPTDHGFISFLFQSLHFRKSLVPLAQGSTRFNLSKSNFLKLTIPIPSIEEQKKIGELLNCIDSKLQKLDDATEVAHAFKRGLLQKMFV